MTGTALVTGGSGYIAGFVIRQLLAEGWSVRTTVRALAREAEVRRTLDIAADAPLRFFAADLMHDHGWADAVAGCSHVVHVASPLPAGAVRHPDDLIVPAREGALRALRFARDAGATRVVMTSSVAAIAYGHGDRTEFSEADWTNLDDKSVTAYPRSKTIAERAARDWIAAEGGDLELVTVNPSLVLGPILSADFSASVEVVKRLLDGSFPGIPPIGFGVVDVRDVSDLHVRALTAPGIAGERFIASGPFLMMADVAAILRDRLGPEARKVPTRRLPGWLLRVAAIFDPLVRQVTGEIGRTRATAATNARDKLGWVPRPAEESIIDAARSLIDRGFVKV